MSDMSNDPSTTPSPPGAPPAPTPPEPPQPYASQPPPPVQAPYVPPPTAPPGSGPTQSDDTTMAMLVHLLSIFTGFVGPLIIWLIKKDQSPFVDRHGKAALNFQITLFIAWIITIVLIFVLIGLLIAPVLFVVGFVFPILGAVKANNGEEYKYPVAIPFIS